MEEYVKLQTLREHISNRMRSVLGIDTAVTLVNPNTIERFQGKARRVVDLRNADPSSSK